MLIFKNRFKTFSLFFCWTLGLVVSKKSRPVELMTPICGCVVGYIWAEFSFKEPSAAVCLRAVPRQHCAWFRRNARIATVTTSRGCFLKTSQPAQLYGVTQDRVSGGRCRPRPPSLRVLLSISTWHLQTISASLSTRAVRAVTGKLSPQRPAHGASCEPITGRAGTFCGQSQRSCLGVG